MNLATGRHFGFLVFLFAAFCLGINAQDNTPRIEVGPILSGATAAYDTSLSFHPGGGGRVTFNLKPIIAIEAESIRYDTGNFPFGDASPEEVEVHSSFAIKGTYRLEQKRWLRFAGVNLFGIGGPGFLNRTVTVADPNPRPLNVRAYLLRRHTVSVFDFGGGVEVVPIRALSIRFDITRAIFSETPAYSAYSIDESRTFVKLAMMFRFSRKTPSRSSGTRDRLSGHERVALASSSLISK